MVSAPARAAVSPRARGARARRGQDSARSNIRAVAAATTGRGPRRSRRRPRVLARPPPRRSRRPRRGSRESAWARSSSRWTSSRSGRVSASARSSRRAAARSSPRQSARRPAAASRSPARSARAASGLSELCLVAGGLLEVVAEDLVQLDEVGAALLEPAGEALVQLGADRLRQRVVGGVADQQVAEAEAVLARELRPGRGGSAHGGRARRGAA